MRNDTLALLEILNKDPEEYGFLGSTNGHLTMSTPTSFNKHAGSSPSTMSSNNNHSVPAINTQGAWDEDVS